MSCGQCALSGLLPPLAPYFRQEPVHQCGNADADVDAHADVDCDAMRCNARRRTNHGMELHYSGCVHCVNEDVNANVNVNVSTSWPGELRW